MGSKSKVVPFTDRTGHMMNSNIIYLTSKNLNIALRQISKYSERTLLVDELIKAYGLFSKLNIVESYPATEKEIESFHSSPYLEFLKKTENETSEGCDDLMEDGEEFGLGYDCPIYPNMFSIISELAGASLLAAKKLGEGICKIAINWAGGWHHAKKDEAAGFCYVNDIVLSILELRRNFDKVLYLDFDLHHGDGVEEAFAHTAKVFCFSIHKFSVGFYPGTGDLESVGFGKGKYHTINVPLKDGIQDEQYCHIACDLMESIYATFKPNCVVCQFGADGLHGDPFKSFNLTQNSYASCLKTILGWEKPTLILGGGGYNPANVARCWTYLTSIICGVELSNEIPDHQFWLAYGPDYELRLTTSRRINLNTDAELDKISTVVKGYLEEIDVP